MATKDSEPLGIVFSVAPPRQGPQPGRVLSKGKVTENGWQKEEVIKINCCLMTNYRNEDSSSYKYFC